jgi:glutathione synthase/RimK-type ligase-like ATP-grasp enzyme
MKKIALVTHKEEPKLEDGERCLFAELIRRGYKPHETPWDEESVDWKKFDTVVLRASWNYHEKVGEFRDWLRRLKSRGINFWNPVEVVSWNIDKHYLRSFERKGITIIPTAFINQGQEYDLRQVIEKLRCDDVIIKPTIGASAWNVGKFSKNDLSSAQQFAGQILSFGDVMVQKFMPQITDEGEYSFMFFDKRFSHAALKKPAGGDFRTQPHFGGSEGVAFPDKNLIEQAQRVVDVVGSPLLYARVDGINDGGILRLMELELAEPYLFFELDKDASERFIEAMEKLVRRARLR